MPIVVAQLSLSRSSVTLTDEKQWQKYKNGAGWVKRKMEIDFRSNTIYIHIHIYIIADRTNKVKGIQRRKRSKKVN
ncbi:hypothetical protein ACH3XW_1765 [Acanthocheilonema viteae]